MQELCITSYSDYLEYISRHPHELQVLDSLLDITISRFWRDRGVFELIDHVVIPDLIHHARASGSFRVRCWSAGCCSGEEAYTLRLLWDIRHNPSDVYLEIIATDRNEAVLHRGERAEFHPGSLKELPQDLLAEGFHKNESCYVIKAQYKRGLTFIKQDIRCTIPDGIFDIILCRNLVFMYFEESEQKRVLEQLISRLRPGGYLISGSSETLPGTRSNLQPIKQGEPVYRIT